MTSDQSPVCINCGLPLVQNHHVDAGKPSMINVVGCPTGCLPCAEKRANGRFRVYADFIRWLDEQIMNAMLDRNAEKCSAFESAKNALVQMENDRRDQFHGHPLQYDC